MRLVGLETQIVLEILDYEDTCSSGKEPGCSRQFAGESLVPKLLDGIKAKAVAALSCLTAEQIEVLPFVSTSTVFSR